VSGQSPEEDRKQLVKAFERSGLRIEKLWLAYFALGGSAGRYEVEAYLAGLMPLSAHEHNVLAQAVNERLADLPPPPRAPYRDPEPAPEPEPLDDPEQPLS
jgi:hypothetical protein